MIKLFFYLSVITAVTLFSSKYGIEVRLLTGIYMSLLFILNELINISKNLKK